MTSLPLNTSRKQSSKDLKTSTYVLVAHQELEIEVPYVD